MSKNMIMMPTPNVHRIANPKATANKTVIIHIPTHSMIKKNPCIIANINASTAKSNDRHIHTPNITAKTGM